MLTLTDYALLGSVLAAATGVVVLATVTLRHALRRRASGAHGGSELRESAVPANRRSDVVALLCFAIAAGLSVVALVHHTRVSESRARANDGALVQRIEALEQRMTSAEARSASPPPVVDPAPWAERLTRLERRVATLEGRAMTPRRPGARTAR